MKNVLIIGGTAGIGKSIDTLLKAKGWNPVVASRSTGCDISDYASLEATFEQVKSLHHTIDHVVVTAADFSFKPFDQTSIESIEHQIQTNLVGPLYVAKLAEQYVSPEGSLLLFASTAHQAGRPNYGIYSATKSGIVRITEALAMEWEDKNLRINCISPGKVKTHMRAQYFGEESLDEVLSPDEVSTLAWDILSTNHTGQIIEIKR